MCNHHSLTTRPSGCSGSAPRRWTRRLGAALLFLNITFSLSAAAPLLPAPEPATMVTGVRTAPGATLLGMVRRRPLTADIAEYSFRLRVGAGPHDIIGLHRVVKEQAPFVPIQTANAVFMVHGDVWGFDAAFMASLTSATTPDGHALPIFLAQQNIDVWGIDLRWTLVPVATVDFRFMQQWGMETDLQDLRTALFSARLTRLATGSDFGLLHLLGWSRGGQIGYAYVSAETQRRVRHVRGFIPVDIWLKTDDQALRRAACERFDDQQAKFNAGTFQDTAGQLAAGAGTLAITQPADPSPIVPGLNNEQAALFLGTSTFAIVQPVPFYHFVGGPAGGLPTGLFSTAEAFWFDFLLGASPYEPVQLLAQGEALVCDVRDLPFDDHLADIAVPVLYVGAGGGFGTFGIYTTTLLVSSPEVSVHIASLTASRIEDFGHADLFLATDAPALVWQPIADWLLSH